MRVTDYMRSAQKALRVVWQFSRWAYHHDYAMVEVPTATLDKLWSKDTLYLAPDDPGIEDRLENLRTYVGQKKSVRLDTPDVYYHPRYKRLSVSDGRHRISLMRALGVPKIRVSVEPENLQDFLRGVPGSKVVKKPAKRVEPK